MSLFPKKSRFSCLISVFFRTFAKQNSTTMAKKKVLFINQEITPYVPESYLAMMGKNLPQVMQEIGHEIRTFMPKWGNINERRGQLHEVIRLSGMNLIIDDTDHPLIIKVASIQSTKIQVYFIDNDDYFTKRLMTVDENGKDYTDNGERAIFFARGVLETVKKLRWTPDIIHCQGWMSAVVPLYLKTAYSEEPSFASAKVVTSLFNKSFSTNLNTNFKKCVEFRETKSDMLKDYDDNFGFEELGKLAIDYSDGVIKAHPDVSEDLMEYAKAKGVPVLDYHEDFATYYEDFYQKICPED